MDTDDLLGIALIVSFIIAFYSFQVYVIQRLSEPQTVRLLPNNNIKFADLPIYEN